jgi:hypothetical protein
VPRSELTQSARQHRTGFQALRPHSSFVRNRLRRLAEHLESCRNRLWNVAYPDCVGISNRNRRWAIIDSHSAHGMSIEQHYSLRFAAVEEPLDRRRATGVLHERDPKRFELMQHYGFGILEGIKCAEMKSSMVFSTCNWPELLVVEEISQTQINEPGVGGARFNLSDSILDAVDPTLRILGMQHLTRDCHLAFRPRHDDVGVVALRAVRVIDFYVLSDLHRITCSKKLKNLVRSLVQLRVLSGLKLPLPC